MRRALAPLLDLSRAERLVVLAFWVVGVAQGFAQSHAANTLPFTRVTFGLTEGEMAGVMALTRIGAFSAILVSFISDRSGRRNLFVGTLALMVGAAGATGWVVDAEQFTIAQGVMRAASTAAGVLAVVMLAELLPAGSRAIGMGIYAAAASLGAGLSVLLLPLAEAGPEEWRVLFQYALIGFVAIPVALRWIPEPPKPSGPRRRWRGP